jgi:hypothetical protein
MTDPQFTAAPLVITPSERVLLFGDRFAKPAGMLGDREEILSSGAKVVADDLAEKMMLAAFLACERGGAIRLEPRQGKAMFGLMTTSHLHLLPGQKHVGWPDGSLESWVVQGAGREPRFTDWARALLGSDKSYQPALGMFARLKGVLAARGVLHAEEKKTMKIFSSVAYSLPPHARAAAEQGGTEHVQRTLDECRQQRPQLWSDMTRGISAAIDAMTQSAPD